MKWLLMLNNIRLSMVLTLYATFLQNQRTKNSLQMNVFCQSTNKIFSKYVIMLNVDGSSALRKK